MKLLSTSFQPFPTSFVLQIVIPNMSPGRTIHHVPTRAVKRNGAQILLLLASRSLTLRVNETKIAAATSIFTYQKL